MAKIVHVSEFTKGGIETHLNELLRYQQSIHDIHLIVSEQNSSKETLRISPDRLRMYPYRRKPLYMARAIMELRRAIGELQPDIVHVHGTFAGVFLRLALLLRKRRPVVVYCAHGWSFLMDAPGWKKRLYAITEKALSFRTDAIIHISRNEYEMALRYGLPRHKSVVVYNGVSDADPSPEKQLEGDSERIKLLYIGRFDRQKGFDKLLETFRGEAFPNVTLYLAGGAVLSEQSYDFPPDAVPLGWIDNAEIDGYIAASDAVIVPSRWEGFGIVAIEALRGGKPVIASNRGALPEIVQHGVNGYVFDFDDTTELASIIRGLDKEKLRTMGKVGADIFRSNFHSDGMNASIGKLYEEAIKRRGKGRSSSAVGEYV